MGAPLAVPFCSDAVNRKQQRITLAVQETLSD